MLELPEEESEIALLETPGSRSPWASPRRRLPALRLVICTWCLKLRRSERWKECRVAILRH